MRPWQKKPKVEGLIAYYDLIDWWLSSFTKDERTLIDERYQPMSMPAHTLTQGQRTSSLPITEFLNALASWFRSKNDASISRRIHGKIEELGIEHPIFGPGYYNGRHFTTYVSEVEALKRLGKLEETETLLLQLVAATEAEDQVERQGVAPWYYEELAKIYRQQKEYAKEVGILERFAAQRHAPGVKPSQLAQRLEKARVLLASRPQPT